MRQVIDASVVLAYIMDEPRGDVLTREDGPFALSSVNLAEILSKMVDRGLDPDDVMHAIRRIPIEHVDHGHEDARTGAALRIITRSLGLSLGDRACLALAQRIGAPALTADTTWSKLAISGVDVRLIR